MKKKIAIIGGGIGGLTVGYFLKKKNYEVTVYEKEKDLGGLMGSFEINGKKIEKTYHHIFASDTEIINLIKELGLDKQLIWRNENMAVIYQNKVYAFNSPIDLLRFSPLDLIDKVRLGLVSIYLQKENNYQKFEKIRAYQWIKKYFGKNVYRVLWQPLLKGKFGKDYKEINMTWFWARIHYRGHSKLGYMKGGFGQIINKLSKNLNIIYKNVKAENLKGYDLIIDTSPIKSVKYLGAVDVIFTSKQNLSKYYWHNINDEKAPFVAFIQQTNMIDDYGSHVYYMGGYYPQDHKYFKVKDEIIYQEFFEYLKKIFKEFEAKEIEKRWIFKFPYAQHMPRFAGSSNNQIPRSKYIIHMNFAQIYPQDRGINYAVKQSRELASLL